MSLISLHSPVSLQPTQRPRVNDAHPLARDLVFAAVPVPGGYWDASPYANHALQRTGNANAALNVAGGSGYAFTTSDHFTTLGTSSTPVLSTANGFSMALWVNFSTGTPTSYGAVFGRNGTTGATHAGGDWSVTHKGSTRALVLTRSGAELASASGAVSGGEWALWHLSVSAAGAFQWWLTAQTAEDTITRGSGTGCPIRTGAGVLHINAALTGSTRSNSQVGRVYLWNRESTIADARFLYRDEWGLFAPQERRIWVPAAAGGGAVNLSIADALHAHAADSLTLTSSTALSIAEALHAHAADSLTLSTTGSTSLTVADAGHAHTADNLSLTTQLALAIQDALHAHAAEGLTLSTQAVLAVADALHAHTADNLDLSGAPALQIADGLHAHTADGVSLTLAAYLLVADARHNQLADNVVLFVPGGATLREVLRLQSPICMVVTADSIITRAVALSSAIDIESAT